MTIAASANSATLSQFVLKVHSRCDLACDHCYVYEHADQTWRSRPLAMSDETVMAAAGRIAQHAAAHELSRVRVVLHGGEPLLLGLGRLTRVVETLRSIIEPATALDLRMQSNGVLLTEALCEMLVANGVKVGVSLDGDEAANDRHRRFATGRSSYSVVVRALELLRSPSYRPAYAGLLCTVDVRNDPIEVYEALATHEPPQIDFLMPHATWQNPPPSHTPGGWAHGDWLAAVYRRWLADTRPLRVRLFDSLIASGAGRPSATEWVGITPADLAVIETDGAWEQPDSLKTAFHGAPATGLDVFAHSADEVAGHPDVVGRRRGLHGLCPTCRACDVVAQCGGGLLAHRYRKSNGFDNPSVYCDDLKRLISVVNDYQRQRPVVPSRATRRKSSGPEATLDALGHAAVDEAVMRELVDQQYAITRSLVAAVAQTARDGSARARDAWAIIVELDKSAPAAVREVFRHPYVRAAATQVLRRHRGTVDHRDAGAWHLLGGLAASAAIIAARPVDLSLAVAGHRIHLPGLGSVAVPVESSEAVVAIRPEGFEVQAGDWSLDVGDWRRDSGADADALGWWTPNRRVAVGGLSVLIEDTDPARRCHEWDVSPRLSASAFDEWASVLSDAVGLVVDESPAYLPALRSVLRVVTPLDAGDGHEDRGSSARHAFGAIAVSRSSPENLAVMLVHELAHLLLGAALDVLALYQPGRPERIAVNWRSDPRPIEGVLQGAYAHKAVADVWRGRRDRRPADAHATAEHRKYRAWTQSAMVELRSSGALTAAGLRLLASMEIDMGEWRP